MKKLLFVLSFLLVEFSFSQVGDWVWVKGNNTPNQLGVYGTQGVSSPLVNPPGVYEPIEWTDKQGNFWVMGGQNSNGLSNDLWKYDRITNEWTWMKGQSVYNQVANYGTQGVSASTNLSGGRGVCSTSWTDSIGNLWLFGGWECWDAGGGNNIINDLWKYNIATNEWTWMKGSNIVLQSGVYGTLGVPNINNTPGCRYETCASWTDGNGNLWFFGGYGKGSGSTNGYMNDIWKYNIASNMWTWMSGSSLPNQPPIYGIKGVPSSTNTPGGRWVYSKWIDASGNLWIFGGERVSNTFYNDLWKYDVSTNMWTWVNGPSITNDPGNYGLKCLQSSNNMPPARSENRACWKDNCGRFWFLGGTTLNWAAQVNNDLWCYDPLSDLWTWVSGNNTPNQWGSYGTQGVSAPTNLPPSRLGAVGWKNGADFWLFGGRNNSSFYNDLWKYTIDPTCPACNSLGVGENVLKNISIFPNPASGFVSVKSEIQINKIRIYNYRGEIIFDQLQSDKSITLDLSKYQSGVYFIYASLANNEILMRKLIVNDQN